MQPIKQYVGGANVGYANVSGPTTYQPAQATQQDQSSLDISSLEDIYDAYENITGLFGGGEGLTNMGGETVTNMLGEPVSAVGGEMTGEAAGSLDLFGGFEGSGFSFGGEAAAGGGEAAVGGESAMAGAGWWALLAAVIVGNEDKSRQEGYRDEDHGDWALDALGGKVVEQDVDKFADKGNFEGTMLHDSMQFGADLATLDFSNAWDLAKEESPILRGLRSIF